MSFSAEMKDFINAYSAGQKINASKTDQEYKNTLSDAQKKKTERDNDPATLELQDKQARANLAATNARIGLVGEQMKNARVSRGYTQALTDRVKNAGSEGTGLLPPTMGGATTAPAIGGAPNLTNTMAPDVTDHYAEGGVIPDGPDAEDDDDEDDATAGVGPAAGQGDTDVSARRRTPAGINGVVSPQLINDAVKSGYQYGVQAFGLGGGVRGPRSVAAAKALAQGQGALSPQEMEAARRAVDPQGKLTDSQRNMAALGSVYQYWANKGEPEKAQRVAFQMLQHFRMASQRYAAIAAHAAEQGNMDLATKAAVKAYANVPDGKDMMLTVKDGRILYHYTDENGKTITKGIAKPEELASSAMGLATTGFDKAILSAAGQREEATKATSKGNASGSQRGAVQDMKGRQELLDPALQEAQDAWKKKNGTDADPELLTSIRDGATHIMQQNPGLTPHEAVDAAMQLTTTKKGNPAADFTTTSDGGLNTVKLSNGKTVKLDDDQFDAMMTQRAARIKAQQAQEAKDAADTAASNKRWDTVKSGAAKIGGAIADDARQFGGEVSNMVPEELKARGKSALDAAGRAYDDYGKPALDAMTNPNINYGTLTTAIGQGVKSALQALQRGVQAPVDNRSPASPGAIPASPDDRAQFDSPL